MSLRQFGSVFEGHPTPKFKYVDVATGSLGQGLSMDIGMALGFRTPGVRNLTPGVRVWTLLGDSEMAEGQVWEAMSAASHYKLDNLVAILDVNRLGQYGPTMLEWDLSTYDKRAQSFGWNTIVLEDGHDLEAIRAAYAQIDSTAKNHKPTMIIAKTIKGKGVSFLEDKDNWHGKAVPPDQLESALKELGEVNQKIIGDISLPQELGNDQKRVDIKPRKSTISLKTGYEKGALVATREAYGDALVEAGGQDSQIIALDAEVANSTYEDKFAKVYPDRFFQMYIAEQQMVSTAVGLAKIGYTPFLSTFAAFLTRAFDQIRMAQYSQAHLNIVGSHCGVSIGQDGPSQMALEDIAMFKSISKSVIFYPSDANSAIKLVELMSGNGINYLRTTREKTPVIYDKNVTFKIGGSQVLHESPTDKAVVCAAGITLHEALKAYEELQNGGINIAVVDLYSIKPIDIATINRLAQQSKHVIVVEDHYAYGGIGESVKMAIKNDGIKFTHLAVKKLPHSGKPAELLNYEEIDAISIVKAVKS